MMKIIVQCHRDYFSFDIILFFSVFFFLSLSLFEMTLIKYMLCFALYILYIFLLMLLFCFHKCDEK